MFDLSSYDYGFYVIRSSLYSCSLCYHGVDYDWSPLFRKRETKGKRKEKNGARRKRKQRMKKGLFKFLKVVILNVILILILTKMMMKE